MLSRSVLFLVVVMLMISCGSGGPEGQVFGEGVSLKEAIPAGDLFAAAGQYNGQVVRVQGTISDMCKHKGCWMQIADGDQVLTVRFQDDAFTIPLESSGRSVDVQGILIAETIAKPLGKHGAEGGDCCGDAAAAGGCEMDRLAKQPNKFTMVSNGLVLL